MKNKVAKSSSQELNKLKQQMKPILSVKNSEELRLQESSWQQHSASRSQAENTYTPHQGVTLATALHLKESR